MRNRTVLRIIGTGVAAVPFAFGAIRALQTGTDVRYLATAFASLAAASVLLRRRRPGRDTRSLIRIAGLAMFGATLFSAAVALALGAHSIPAILVVACGFSICTTTGVALSSAHEMFG